MSDETSTKPKKLQALYVTDDPSPEGWLPYLREVIGFAKMTNEAGGEKLVALVAEGYNGSAEVTQADAIPGFVTLVDEAMTLPEIVTMCRNFVAEHEDDDDGDGEEPTYDPAKSN